MQHINIKNASSPFHVHFAGCIDQSITSYRGTPSSQSTILSFVLQLPGLPLPFTFTLIDIEIDLLGTVWENCQLVTDEPVDFEK
jgi:hypothetical protein